MGMSCQEGSKDAASLSDKTKREGAGMGGLGGGLI